MSKHTILSTSLFHLFQKSRGRGKDAQLAELEHLLTKDCLLTEEHLQLCMKKVKSFFKLSLSDKAEEQLLALATSFFWSAIHTNGSREQALAQFMRIQEKMKAGFSIELYTPFMKVGCFLVLWSLLNESVETFSHLLKNDVTGRIFIVNSSLTQCMKGLFDLFFAQCPIEQETKRLIQKELLLVEEMISCSMKEQPPITRTSAGEKRAIIPTLHEKAILAPTHMLLQWLKEGSHTTDLVKDTLKATKAFLFTFSEAASILEMPSQSKEEASSFCHLFNMALLSGMLKTLGLHGVQGCEEKRHTSHWAQATAQAFERDLESLLEAYISW